MEAQLSIAKIILKTVKNWKLKCFDALTNIFIKNIHFILNKYSKNLQVLFSKQFKNSTVLGIILQSSSSEV